MRYWLGFVGLATKSCPRPLQLFNASLGTVLEGTLPWRHILSPTVGPSLAYPILKQRAHALGFPVSAPLELYDYPNATIHYIQPLRPIEHK